MKGFHAHNQNLIQDKMDDTRLLISHPITISKALSEMQTIFWKYGGKHVPAQGHIKELFTKFQDDLVAAKDTEIAELKAQVEGLKTDMQHSRLIESVQVKEANELKAESKYWKDRWEAQNQAHDAEFSSIIAQNAENKRLKDELGRLRDGIKKGFEKLAEIPYCSVLRTIFDNANGVQNDLESLLSPAPVTEGTKKTFSLQMYECNRCEWYGQVGESIETESYDVCPKCLSEDLTLLDSPKNEDQE